MGADKTITKCSDSSTNLNILYTVTGLNSNWKLNGVTVSNPAAVFTAGVYQLIATNTSGCADTALVTVVNDVLLCPVLKEKITISPNPVTDQLTIAVIRIPAVKTEITIHNTAGQKVYSNVTQQAAGGQTYSIPMKQLAGGIYYITIKLNGKKEITKKILRQ